MRMKDSKSNKEMRVISKRDEERIKSIIREEPKIQKLMHDRVDYRNNFLKSQKLINYSHEISRLQGLEGKIINNVRYHDIRSGHQEHQRMQRLFEDNRYDLNKVKSEYLATRFNPGPDIPLTRYY